MKKWYFRALDTEITIPEVVEDTRNTHTNNPDYKLFRAGEWSFELPEEDDIENARDAIGAWIAWYLYLSEKADK